MEITEEYIVTMLMKAGGKMKNSDIVSKFQSLINCDDPVEKKQNRDVIKNVINTVAVVKEMEDGKYVVLKKKYLHLLGQFDHDREESAKAQVKTEFRATIEDATGRVDKVQDGDRLSDPEDKEHIVDSCENTSPNSPDDHSPILLALQRSKAVVDLKPEKSLNFVRAQVMSLNESSLKGQEVFPGQAPATISASKPCALPLRLLAIHTTGQPLQEECIETSFQEGRAPDGITSTLRNKRRPGTDGSTTVSSSPLLHSGCKNSMPLEEQPSKHSLAFPLNRNEHDWHVKSAAGQWDQVYALLLRDTYLAQKSDFVSGFTVLHWAAKCGHSSMVTKIMELSRRHGSGVDVNTKTHGGYTPLHIAALHDQEYIMTMLVKQYDADVRIRDNCGKRAYYYLHKGVSDAVRELLGGPPRQAVVVPQHPEKEDGEVHKGHHKEHHSTLSRLFQPNGIVAMTGNKRAKPKLREVFYSASENIRDAILTTGEELRPKLRETFQSVGEEPRGKHTEDQIPRRRESLYSASEQAFEE